ERIEAAPFHLTTEPIEPALVGIGNERIADLARADQLLPGMLVQERGDPPARVLTEDDAQEGVLEDRHRPILLEREHRPADRGGGQVLRRVAEARQTGGEEPAAFGRRLLE